jgi:hypothetical protein
MSGRNCSSTSPAEVTSVAPLRIRRLVPSARAGHGEHLAPLFESKAGGVQRARARRRLDDHDAEAHAGDDAVAAGKVFGARRKAERHLRQHGAASGDDVGAQGGVLFGIDVVDAAGHHGDGAAVEGGAVGAAVDAASEAGDDDDVGFTEAASDAFGHLLAGDRGVARTDDGSGGVGHQLGRAAKHGDQRWWRGDGLERRRIERFADGHQATARRCRPFEFALGVGATGDGDVAAGAAAPGERRQGVQRRVGGAEVVDQAAEGGRSHVFGPDEAKPGDPLVMGKLNHGASWS